MPSPPSPPSRGYSFTSFQTANPVAPLPASNLDAEIDRSNQAITQLITFARSVIADDGSLRLDVVTADHLSQEVRDVVGQPQAAAAQAAAQAALSSASAAHVARDQAIAAVAAASAAARTYEHVQSAPALTWTINHNLGFRPAVTVRNAGGIEVEADVMHLSDTTARIDFLIPQTGTARFT